MFLYKSICIFFYLLEFILKYVTNLMTSIVTWKASLPFLLVLETRRVLRHLSKISILSNFFLKQKVRALFTSENYSLLCNYYRNNRFLSHRRKLLHNFARTCNYLNEFYVVYICIFLLTA